MICIKCGHDVQDGPFCSQCGARQSAPARKPATRKRGNGTGTAFRRGKSWCARVTAYSYAEVRDDGSKHIVRRYKSKDGFATKKEALEYIPKLQLSDGRTAPTLLSLWLDWSSNELPRLSESKQFAYKKARERLEPIIGRKIDTLTTSDLQAAVNSGAKSYYTARDMKTLLSHCYKRAMADRFVPSNLSQFIVLPELTEKEAVPFSAAEVEKMWNAFSDGDWFVGYLLLMIYSGMMPGELFACRKDMIDWDRCEIFGCGKKTKTRKNTSIVFAECVKPVLLELCETVPGETLQPRYETEFYDEYHNTTQRIGIRDLPPYSCRHTTGTEAARQNLSASMIQKIMRHAKITTSQRYIHFGSSEAHTGINSLPGQQIRE